MTRGTALRVFGRRGDPEGIALAVAREVPGGEVERHRRTWRVSATSKKGLFRPGKPDLVVEVDSTRFEGGGGARERDQVSQTIARSMRGPGLERVLRMIPELQISVSFVPEADGPVPPTHPLFAVALDVATRTDGFVLDEFNGRLLSATGEVWGSKDLADAEGTAPADPSPTRVGARLVVLVAVAARALTEYDGRDLDEARHGILGWVDAVGCADELEDFEGALLRHPPGGLDDAALAFGSWQIEGAVALAWSLGLVAGLPPHDQAVDPAVVSGALRFPDAAATSAALRSCSRRLHAMVELEAARQYAIHWRLSDFAERGEALDLAAWARNAQQGPLRFGRVPLLGGDLAVGDRPVAEADPDVVEVSLGVVGERLRALNWLRRGGRYSAVELTP